MAQSITLKIADKEYPLSAATPEAEQELRLAAESVNRVLATYKQKFSNKSPEDIMAFVALNESTARIRYQKMANKLTKEVETLQAELATYLSNIEADR